MNRNGIFFESLSVRFGSKVALEELSFVAKPGEITGLLGRNGAGKTTALRALVGLISADSGTALIDEVTFAQHRPGVIGVSLDAAFPPARRVYNQLKATALAFDISHARVDEVVEILELGEFLGKKCVALSLGMKQRLSIACAILSDPQVLILDEPVNGLDPDGIKWLHEHLRRSADSGKTILVSSHYLHDMEKYVDHAVILQKRLLWEGDWSPDREESLESIFIEATSGTTIS